MNGTNYNFKSLYNMSDAQIGLTVLVFLVPNLTPLSWLKIHVPILISVKFLPWYFSKPNDVF